MNWEKEFDNKFRVDDGILEIWEQVLPDGDWEGRTAVDLKEIKAFISKQRKELLDEVREKVIGKEEKIYGSDSEDIRNDFRKEQLKKLKELEEGNDIWNG